MPDRTIDVDVRPETERTLEVEPTAVTVDGPFVLTLRGHDAPAHIHCRPEGDLADVVAIERANYYVEPGDELPVEVAVETLAEPVTGSIEVAVRYGAESVDLSVTVEPDPEPVAVDGTFVEPRRDESDPTASERVASAAGVRPGTLGVAALGAVTLAIAAATAAIVGSPTAFLGLLVVVAGVAVAAALVLS